MVTGEQEVKRKAAMNGHEPHLIPQRCLRAKGLPHMTKGPTRPKPGPFSFLWGAEIRGQKKPSQYLPPVNGGQKSLVMQMWGGRDKHFPQQIYKFVDFYNLETFSDEPVNSYNHFVKKLFFIDSSTSSLHLLKRKPTLAEVKWLAQVHTHIIAKRRTWY